MTKENLIGKKFNKLTVLNKTDKRSKGNEVLWRFQCDCENQTIIEKPMRWVKFGNTKSCGCLSLYREYKYKDLTGHKYHKLTVIKTTGTNKHGQRLWECQCDCRNQTLVTLTVNHIGINGTKSCGCLHKEVLSKRIGALNHSYNPLLTDKDRTDRRIGEDHKLWRMLVYIRDNYICQCCGYDKGHKLNAHHIESYAKNKDLRTDLNNGITLCKKCHISLHSKYGKFTCRKNLEDFLNETRTKDISK